MKRASERGAIAWFLFPFEVATATTREPQFAFFRSCCLEKMLLVWLVYFSLEPLLKAQQVKTVQKERACQLQKGKNLLSDEVVFERERSSIHYFSVALKAFGFMSRRKSMLFVLSQSCEIRCKLLPFSASVYAACIMPIHPSTSERERGRKHSRPKREGKNFPNKMSTVTGSPLLSLGVLGDARREREKWSL